MRKRPDDAPDLFSVRCNECGRYLITTPSGYYSCPLGHGKLLAAQPELPQADTFLMFPDEASLENRGRDVGQIASHFHQEDDL